jgi:hypothetical protein
VSPESHVTGLLIWPCRLGLVHDPHNHQAKVAGATEYGPVHCPGVKHDHAKRCCIRHDHHTTPHKGCILR